MAVISELITVLGVEVDPTTIAVMHKMQEGLDKIESVGKKATIAIAAFSTGFGFWIKSIATNAEDLLKLAKNTGVSSEKIQAMDYAVEQLGYSSKNLNSDLLSLTKSMTSPVPGEFNVALAQLGINAYKFGGGIRNVADVLEDLSARLGKMSMTEALQWGSRLGISVDTINLLREGRAGIKALQQQAESLGLIIPTGAQEGAVKFLKVWRDIEGVWGGISNKIGLGLMPKLTELLTKFRDWVTLNKNWIALKVEQVILGIVSGFDKFYHQLGKVWQSMQPYVKAIGDALGLTGNLKDKTEQFINLALWGLAAMGVLWAYNRAKMLLVYAAILVVADALDTIMGITANKHRVIDEFFRGIALAAADAVDSVQVLIDLLRAFPALAVRLGAATTNFVGNVANMPQQTREFLNPKDRRRKGVDVSIGDEILAYAKAEAQYADEVGGRKDRKYTLRQTLINNWNREASEGEKDKSKNYDFNDIYAMIDPNAVADFANTIKANLGPTVRGKPIVPANPSSTVSNKTSTVVNDNRRSETNVNINAAAADAYQVYDMAKKGLPNWSDPSQLPFSPNGM